MEQGAIIADGITSGAILKRTAHVVRGNAALAAGAFAALTLLGVAMDLIVGPDGSGNLAVSGIATVFAQYWITTRVMDARGIASTGAGGYRATGFGAVFGVCLLSNLGIILGLVLLIVPGLILAVRWFPAVPALIGEDVGVTEALGESWRKTKGHGAAIFGAMVVIYLPLILVFGMAFGVGMATADGGADPSGTFAFSLPFNMLTSLAAVIGWHGAIAFWELRAPSAPALADVFA